MYPSPNFHKIKSNHPKTEKLSNSDSSSISQATPLKPKFSAVLYEFCERTTIHGVGHLADRNCHWIERIWWIIAIAISTVVCTIQIYCVWTTDPLTMTIGNDMSVIGSIPFPAVSICPITKAAVDKFNFTAVYRSMLRLDGNRTKNVTSEELKMMKVASQFCNDRIASDVLALLPDEYMDDGVVSTILEMAPKFNDTFIYCKIFGEWKNCNDWLYPIITDFGLCYTFNSLSLKEMLTDRITSEIHDLPSTQRTSNWNMDSGYFDRKDGSTSSYPFRTYSSGIQSSLIVVFRVHDKNVDHLCGGGIQGFTVTFQLPNDVPDVYRQTFHVGLGKAVQLSIEPKVVEIPNEVKKFGPEIRKCYLDSERKLSYFRHYTEQNCVLECLSNFTLAKCGCVSYSMPRTTGMKICGPAKFQCNQRVRHVFQNEEIQNCNCSQACSWHLYRAYASQTDYNMSSSYTKTGVNEYCIVNASFSRLTVSYKEEMYTPDRYVITNSFSNVLAKAGGICSLFMGASLLSFIELIYYATVRIFLTYRKNHRFTRFQRDRIVPLESQQ